MTTIDGRETAPAAMTPTSFWENGAPLPFNDARFSGLSVGVPGTRRDVGRRAREVRHDLARGRAAGRASASRATASSSTRRSSTRRSAIVDWFDDIPRRAALFLDPDGTPHDVGTVFRNPDLAATYERIAHLGAKGFYRGAVADAIVDTVQHPVISPTANHVWRPGRDDDARPAPLRRARAGADARQLPRARRVLDGPAVERRLDGRRGAEHPRGLPRSSSMPRDDALHYFLEASRYSFADRNAYLADPDYFDVPLSGLLSKDYAATRRALITHDRRAGRRSRRATRTRTTRAARLRRRSQSETTTHLVTSDKWGNVVSYTFTIESTGGSGLVVPGLRLPAQQRADRLQLRLADAPEPRRGRQAAAQLDGADDRARRTASRSSRSARRAARRSSRPCCRSSSTGSTRA